MEPISAACTSTDPKPPVIGATRKPNAPSNGCYIFILIFWLGRDTYRHYRLAFARPA